MIPQPQTPGQSARSWQQSLADLVTDPAELLALLGLDAALLPAARAATESFRLRVPREFIARMRPGDPADPLLRQVLPLGEELQVVPGYTGDPLAEAGFVRNAGLLQKYRGRVLVITSGACAVHCRYCFRRHFPYQDNTPDSAHWETLLAQVAADTTLEEVILSGGDPLMVSNRRLAWLVERLSAIPHLRRLRLHTRLPVVIPARLDDGLADLLAGTRLDTVMVIHANHANEIDDGLAASLRGLAARGVTLLNQSVLLAGVNDTAAALADLSRCLLAAGVLPYYLHLLDPVAGAAHFDVPDTRGRQLLQALAAALPGYLVPRLVREEPGAPAKTLVLPGA